MRSAGRTSRGHGSQIMKNASSNPFYRDPILNSPYKEPSRYWAFDDNNNPTGEIKRGRRIASFVTPVPGARTATGPQSGFQFTNPLNLPGYDQNSYINYIRDRVTPWRQLDDSQWGVSDTTRELMRYWRDEANFEQDRPFFCQIEAVETIIWLTEVAPLEVRNALKKRSDEANLGLERWALKMATGSGKTAVMAMIIAWQTLNADRNPDSGLFTSNFLVVAPSVTIKNRLRVLDPRDQQNYYRQRGIVPVGEMPKMNSAQVVIENFHTLRRKDVSDLSTKERETIEKITGEKIEHLEDDVQLVTRVLGFDEDKRNRVLVLNDEGHHCYRSKAEPLVTARSSNKVVGAGNNQSGDEDEVKGNLEDARIWLRGLEAIGRRVPICRVIDLSATPYFLAGSGYAEGTLFPWTVSDFSLMDAIECGIVKLPRVPVAPNVQGNAFHVFRNIWSHVGEDVAEATRGNNIDPDTVPGLLREAIGTLYKNYEATDKAWRKNRIDTPPCFIIVCNNTKTSQLIYEYVSGRGADDAMGGRGPDFEARCNLFTNYDDQGRPLELPNTILIDSRALASDDALPAGFAQAAAGEIAQFRQRASDKAGDAQAGQRISDGDILREVVNTIGKPGELGARVRCVVSVSMLTEGWDANTVTHVLGIRAFSTQLLCEQVVGRALRRYNYDLKEDGRFSVEYAEVFGVPFDFASEPVPSSPDPPDPVHHVFAVPGREELEITFPRVLGYHVRRDWQERISAVFTRDSEHSLPNNLPDKVTVAGVAGETVTMTRAELYRQRRQSVEFALASHLANAYWAQGKSDTGTRPATNGAHTDEFDLRNFYTLRRIVGDWIDRCLEQPPGSHLGMLLLPEHRNTACDKVIAAIDRDNWSTGGEIVEALIDEHHPVGSTQYVDVRTPKDVYQTAADKCHVNYVVEDSGWEREMAEVLEALPRVKCYVKNHGLGLDVPWRHRGTRRVYRPDFIAKIDTDSAPPEDDRYLMIEVKGQRRDDVPEKSEAAEYWCAAVNALRRFGRWKYVYCDDRRMFSSVIQHAIHSFSVEAPVLGGNI